MKKIPLTQGKVAFVDDEDYEYLMQWKWYALNPKKDLWYAVRMINSTRQLIRMHRVIKKIEDSGVFVDHKDQNGLNNQRINLRVCTRSQNAANRKPKENSSSKYLGVSWHNSPRKLQLKSGEIKIYDSWFWHAAIKINQKVINLGNYREEKDAAKAYNKAATKYHGEFANLNKV